MFCPFDVVSTRLYAGATTSSAATVTTTAAITTNLSAGTESRRYRGAWHCAVDMIRTEGVLALQVRAGPTFFHLVHLVGALC